MTVSCKRDEALDITNTEYISFKFSDDALSAIGTLTKGTCDTLSYEITDWDYTGEESNADVQTKGTLTESLSGNVGLFMLQVPGKAAAADTLMKNDFLSVSGSSVTASSQILWKDRTVGSNLVSFAYAPYSDTVKVRGAKPYIMYTVPGNVTEQKDILYAVDTTQIPSSSSARKPIDLKFRHALTAVQFKMNFDTLNIKSIKLVGVANIGKLFAGNVEVSGNEDFEISLDPGKKYKKDSLLNAKENTFIMLPQAFGSSSTATIVITFNDNSTLSAPLKDQVWPAGKKVTYTLKKVVPPGTVEYIYFDFSAGDIILTSSKYAGYVFVNGDTTKVTGTHSASNRYYVYQSAPADSVPGNPKVWSANTGYVNSSEIGTKVPTLPEYTAIDVDGKSWGEYVTNNTDPTAVLAKWNSFPENFLEPKPRRILIYGDSEFDVTLDRVYSRYFPYRGSTNGSGEQYEGIITTAPSGTEDSRQYKDVYGGITVGQYKLDKYNSSWTSRPYKEKVTLRLKGNNYFSRIEYAKQIDEDTSKDGYLKITSEKGDGIAEGTLTVTLPYLRTAHPTPSTDDGLLNFVRCALIGGGSNDKGISDTPPRLLYREVRNLYFNGGIVYCGVEKIRNSNWTTNENMIPPIGTNNADTEITINGGIVTAVSNGTGPAIGGGAGWLRFGGKGTVTINGGTVYAYSFGVFNANTSVNAPVMSAAIGGGSSGNKIGEEGVVTINGGTVHAYSVGGCAIGGGTSAKQTGGTGTVTINGGNIYANSVSGTIGASYAATAGVAIGGGRSGISNGYNGGEAVVTIKGGTIIAGSVGGGKCGNSTGKLGRAEVTVDGGETSAQFLLVKDKSASTANTFTMTGGVIKNSKTSDTEYIKTQNNGGAVYMESGTCTISGGTIEKCSADTAGAIFMNGGTFTMTGGEISNCSASTHGGAVYVDGGNAFVNGGIIQKNLASKGNGGGVYVSAGDFTMDTTSTAKINYNSADAYDNKHGNGGGIYVRSTTKNVKVDIIGGEVQYNAADRNGGGLCVDMEGSDSTATIRIGENGGPYNKPLISMNSAALSGGGMAVQGSGSNIYIYSGTVKGNVSAYVKNEDIRNDGGMVDLVGKNSPGVVDHVDVNYKTITFYANNNEDPEPYDEQRVITSTNSPLTPTATALAFEKEFYKKVSWNTKRDGSGVTYNLNGIGEVMNITTDISLYAQWEENQ